MKNLALKAKWLQALRSGEHAQTKEHLHKDGAYCCLGVLCKIAGADMTRKVRGMSCGEVETTAFIDDDYYTDEEELGHLKSYFGIKNEVETALITMNDAEGRDFQEIADWIAQHDLLTGDLLLSCNAEAPNENTRPVPRTTDLEDAGAGGLK